MTDFVLPTLAALIGVLAGYGATTLYHRRRARDQDTDVRLLRGRDTDRINALRSRLAEKEAAQGVLASATDTIDAAYARLTARSQEGGPTP
ncbi:hypothetical protein [Streptomyces sp. WAC08241]|uniref:hypothetical protein n=1 Tax=Streptomyces sp. WAC08241 TaxID=2487421 RepID=UPI000F76B044|nr:hypothetical protein [Streptomyces sp. WAC08241]RSS43851.1 hypothetical protein EF906_08885 [Streptomyces sp. WAC08241]